MADGAVHPGRQSWRADDDLMAGVREPVDQVADMTPDAAVGRLMAKQDAHRTGSPYTPAHAAQRARTASR
jgi:hypothetical protein